MFTCDKCGARLADGLKYCNKCGSQVNETSESNADFVGLNDIKPLEEPQVKDKTGFGLYLDNACTYIYHLFFCFYVRNVYASFHRNCCRL